MSGWIKVEKDLETDPRVLRMSKALDLHRANACSCDPCNAHALPGVTLVVGALARLWMYADSHARDDDTLDLSTAELDEWLGIPGFCSLMPADWLVVIDENTLELPSFQEHNNTEAKKRALGQKRQEKYRHKQQRTSVTPRNAGASLDQTKTRPVRRDAAASVTTPVQGELQEGLIPDAVTVTRAHAFRGTRLPEDFLLTTERRAVAQAEGVEPIRTFAKFWDYWRGVSGTKGTKLDWDATWRNWCRSEGERNPRKPGGADNGLPTLNVG